MTPQHTNYGVRGLFYIIAVLGLVMFVTWFLLLAFFVTHLEAPPAPEPALQLQTL